jgi:serine/threonine protein kinase
VWMSEYQGRKVAVKVLRVYSTSDLDKITSVGDPRFSKSPYRRADDVVVAQRFCKEAVTWRSLRHPNVLPLLGVTMSGKVFAMVSEWMINGNINEFVKAHGDANRFELVGFCPHRWPQGPSLMKSLLTARRCCLGIAIYARRGDDTWGPEGGMNSNADCYSTT